uniref:Uncharacterized protein n=1 Tax=Loa loa TaxID=7209 RepID=A0A1I7W2V8_LOALO
MDGRIFFWLRRQKLMVYLGHLKYLSNAHLGATEGNPQLGHTLADTRNHHIADQSSVGQQDHSSDDYLPENFNIGSPDINILDYCDFAALGPDIVTLFSE